MATFSEAQVTSLARIFGATSDYMSQWLSIRAGIITDADKTALLLDITAYVAEESNNVDVEPNVRNFGSRISASAKRSLIKKNIAGLIGWETSSGSHLVRS